MIPISQEKKDKIRKTLAEKRIRRKSQSAKVFELKIDQSHLNQAQSQYLKMIFIEAKWFYNYLLSQEDIFKSKELTKHTFAIVKKESRFEKREFKFISSQVKLALYDRICSAIKALSVLKSHKFSVGRLKFKPEINSIDYIQHKVSWKIKGDKIRLQGLKKSVKVHGLEQIKSDYELANCRLIRCNADFFVQITCYEAKEQKTNTYKVIGLDFGIKDNIVTSDGEKYNFSFPETDKLKKLQQHFSRKVKGSRNRMKNLFQIKKEHQNIFNRKKDAFNKFVSKLIKENDHICIQDEMIKSWHKGLFGRKVQHSILGAIKSKLKTFESTLVIDAKKTTTKQCHYCSKMNDIKLKDRVFKCNQCDYTEDRDVKSAKTILFFGLELLNKSKSCGTQDYTYGADVNPEIANHN